MQFSNIQNFELTCEDSVKLLGIEIDYQLNLHTYKYNLQKGIPTAEHYQTFRPLFEQIKQTYNFPYFYS